MVLLRTEGIANYIQKKENSIESVGLSQAKHICNIERVVSEV